MALNLRLRSNALVENKSESVQIDYPTGDLENIFITNHDSGFGNIYSFSDVLTCTVGLINKSKEWGWWLLCGEYR